MFSREIFSARLVELRKKSGLSSTALGEVVGVSGASITQLEKAQRSPSVEVLGRLADCFGVSLDYLSGNDVGASVESRDSLYMEIIGLPAREREEVLLFARFIKAHPR